MAEKVAQKPATKTASKPAAKPEEKAAPQFKKTKCPVTRSQFRKNARSIPLDQLFTDTKIGTKEFSTGSLGWYLNDKIDDKGGFMAKLREQLGVDEDDDLKLQVGINITIVGSKELPNGDDDDGEIEE